MSLPFFEVSVSRVIVYPSFSRSVIDSETRAYSMFSVCLSSVLVMGLVASLLRILFGFFSSRIEAISFTYYMVFCVVR